MLLLNLNVKNSATSPTLINKLKNYTTKGDTLQYPFYVLNQSTPTQTPQKLVVQN